MKVVEVLLESHHEQMVKSLKRTVKSMRQGQLQPATTKEILLLGLKELYAQEISK